MRRDAGLVPQDKIAVYFKIDFQDLKDLISRSSEMLKKEVGAGKLELINQIKEGLLIDRHIQLENQELWVGLAKIR